MERIGVSETDGLRTEGEEKKQISNEVQEMDVTVNRNRKKKIEKN